MDKNLGITAALATAGLGLLTGAIAGVAFALVVAPHAALYVSAVIVPLLGGLGLMTGLVGALVFASHRQQVMRILVLLLPALASGCAADGWDCICQGGTPPTTHLINGQLIAELARDQR